MSKRIANQWPWLLILIVLCGCETIPEPVPVMTETPTVQSETIKHRSPAIIVLEERGLALWELETARHKIIFEGHDTFIMWDKTGCTMIVRDWSGDLYQMDLSGKIIKKIFSFNPLEQIEPDNIAGYQVVLSPSMDWVAYWIGRGQPLNEIGLTSEYEIQDIRTTSLDLSKGPYNITTSGGGWDLAWSPDGQRLAFSDYDDDHTLQVFVATRTGEQRKQITSFGKEVLAIAAIEWSEDGKNLAIESMVEGREIISYYRNDDQPGFIEDPESLFLGWWIDNETFLYFRPINKWDLYKMNTITGEGSKISIAQVFSYVFGQFQTPEKIGIFGEDSGFFVYDIRNDTYKHYSNINPEFYMGAGANWSAVPNIYETGNCR